MPAAIATVFGLSRRHIRASRKQVDVQEVPDGPPWLETPRNEVSTPVTTRHFKNYGHGEVYGIASTLDRFIMPELGARTTIRSLYLTGQDTASLGVGVLYGGAIADPVRSEVKTIDDPSGDPYRITFKSLEESSEGSPLRSKAAVKRDRA